MAEFVARVGSQIAHLSLRMRHLLRRKRDYDAVFKGPGGVEVHQAGAAVLRDIAQFCAPYKSTARFGAAGTLDPLAMARAEGRREVFLHLQRRLRLTDDQILDMAEEAKND